MKRKNPIKPAELYPLHKHVRELMKEKKMTHKRLSRILRCDRSVVSRLLDTPDWLISEVQAVGTALGTNLFTIYAPVPDAILQQTIAELQQQLTARETELAATRKALDIAEAKLEILREVKGINA